MIAVLTTLDRGQYLSATLAGIDASARSPTKVVVIDRKNRSWAPVGEPGWLSVATPYRSPNTCNRQAFWHVLRTCAELDPRQEYLLFFEDDVEFCSNAVRYLEGLVVPDDIAFVSAFTPGLKASTSLVLVRRSVSEFGYCQALKIPARTIKALLEAEHEPGYRIGGSDGAIQAIGAARSWQYGVLSRPLVQHVGEVSAISNTTCWSSTDFDPTFDPFNE